MLVICSHAGKFTPCTGCPHSVRHDPVKDIDTTTPGRGRTCRSSGPCVLTPTTGRRMDRQNVAKVRCVRAPDSLT